MERYYQNHLDVEQRSTIKAGEMGQLVFSIWTFICSLLIKLKWPHYTSEYSLWVEIMFYGSLIWIAFLLLSIVGKYKDKNIRRFFQITSLLFFAFHIAMWGWLIHLWHMDRKKKEDHFNNASKAGDMFASVYLIFGVVIAIIALVGLIAWIFSKFKKKSGFEDRILGNLGDADEDEMVLYS